MLFYRKVSETKLHDSEPPQPCPDLPVESVIAAGQELAEYMVDASRKTNVRVASSYFKMLGVVEVDADNPSLSPLDSKRVKLRNAVIDAFGVRYATSVHIVLNPDMFAEEQLQTGLPLHNFHTDYRTRRHHDGILQSLEVAKAPRYGMILNGQGTDYIKGLVEIPASDVHSMSVVDASLSEASIEQLLARFPGFILGQDDHLLRTPVDRVGFASGHLVRATKPNVWNMIPPTNLHAVPLNPSLGRISILAE